MDVSLSKKSDSPFLVETVESMINLCKLSIIDQIIDEMNSTNKLLRKKLEKLKIEDFNTALLVQLSVGNIVMKFMKLLAAEIENECKSREIDHKKFMEQAFPYLGGDINVIFELENYYGLKVKSEENSTKIDLELARKYYNQTVHYSKLLIDGKINPQSCMIYPSIEGHFLYNEFGVHSSQMASFVQKYFLAEDQEYDDNFVRLMMKEIYFSEKGRLVIFQMVQMQMEMMAQMMGGGGGMPPMDPSMMGPPPGQPQMNGNFFGK